MTLPENAQQNQNETNEKSTEKEYNFVQIRKQLETERAERKKLEERMQQLQEQKESSYKSSEDEDYYSDEPYVDHKSLKKTLAKEKEELRKELREEAIREARGILEQEKQQVYLKTNGDFQEIMKPEILQRFIDKHPGLAEGILSMPDGFERQKVVYETVKALGLHKKEEPPPSIQQKIDQNRRSPFYQPSGVANAPYAATGDYSTSGQKNAYDKMQELKARLRI